MRRDKVSTWSLTLIYLHLTVPVAATISSSPTPTSATLFAPAPTPATTPAPRLRLQRAAPPPPPPQAPPPVGPPDAAAASNNVGSCGACWVQAEALGQVWDSAIHYYTVATESLVIDPINSVTSLVNSWVVPDADLAMASMTNSLFDSAVHKQFNYDPMVGTTFIAGQHTLMYPTSYLYVQYLTKFWNASTVVNGKPQCVPMTSSTALIPQVLHTMFGEYDADWLTTTRVKDAPADIGPSLKLNVLPRDMYNTIPGFEQCTWGTAIGKLTTKGPVLSVTATTVSYINDLVPMQGMHNNPTDTALGITGAAPGAAVPKGASPPTATITSGTLMASGASMDMPMPSGEMMELCDLLTVGAAVFTGTSGTFSIGLKVLTPAGPPITLFGTVVTEPAPTGVHDTPSVAIVAGTTQSFVRTVMRAAELNRTAKASTGSGGNAMSGSRRNAAVETSAWLLLSALGLVIWL